MEDGATDTKCGAITLTLTEVVADPEPPEFVHVIVTVYAPGEVLGAVKSNVLSGLAELAVTAAGAVVVSVQEDGLLIAVKANDFESFAFTSPDTPATVTTGACWLGGGGGGVPPPPPHPVMEKSRVSKTTAMQNVRLR